MTTDRKQLFNGRDLSGWQMAGRGSFSVQDGALVTEGGMGLLWHTESKVGNATLRVVYRVSRVEDNSGVFIRIDERPKDAWYAVHHGYEVQILETGDDYHRTGGIYSMTRSPEGVQLPPGEWNEMDIILDGLRTTVVLNGTEVTSLAPDDEVPPQEFPYEPERGPRGEFGYIGLQNLDGESIVAFREVSVGPLP
ncbi:MAG: DUF1080 domain-containing protein, partial [Dehalococcoidia bacterium]